MAGRPARSVFGPIGRFLERLPSWFWLLAPLVVVAAIVVGRRAGTGTARRRARATGGRAGARSPDEREDPDALERAADEAERDGDLARAVRLRFRAGLLRLGDRGAIAYRPSVTTGEVRRTLDSPPFDDLAGTFEAVTYGGRAGRPARRRRRPPRMAARARRDPDAGERRRAARRPTTPAALDAIAASGS